MVLMCCTCIDLPELIKSVCMGNITSKCHLKDVILIVYSIVLVSVVKYALYLIAVVDKFGFCMSIFLQEAVLSLSVVVTVQMRDDKGLHYGDYRGETDLKESLLCCQMNC